MLKDGSRKPGPVLCFGLLPDANRGPPSLLPKRPLHPTGRAVPATSCPPPSGEGTAGAALTQKPVPCGKADVPVLDENGFHCISDGSWLAREHVFVHTKAWSSCMPKKVFAPGNRWLVAYLAFLSAFAPLSTDMYLPALPHMTQALQTTDALSSLSISCFLLLFGASMLFWGPLSDKYGRKPVLYAGALLYVVSSLFLALAQSIWPLLFWRAVQAIGSGGISAMALAIVKDVLRGRAMEKVITWIQTITILAPMLAPVIGGALLAVTDWRGIFACLLLCGLLAGAGTLLLRETMHDPVQGNAFRTLGRLLVVLRHRGFRCLLLLFSATSMPFMAYLALSSYIFQGLFGLSPQAYSLFFAFNAGMSMLGPLAHERFFRTAPRRLFFSAYLGIVVVAGLGLLLVGDQGPFIFALLCAPISFCGSALRPPATVLMLNQMRNDTGSLTALINSGGLLFGSLSMLLCALPVWPGPVAAQALMAILVGTACLLGWLWLDSRKIYEG